MDNMVGKIRILLADSDGDFCAEMAALCENAEDMELVGIAESGEKALAAVGELRPDLLITELSLPGMDGVLLPVVLVFQVVIAADRHIMGTNRSGRVWNVLTWATIGVITVLTVVMFVLQAMGYSA